MKPTVLQRARALVAARYVKTRSRTLHGLLRAARRGKLFIPPPRTARPIPRCSLPALLAAMPSWQGHTKVWRLDAAAPIAAAVQAALGAEAIGRMPARRLRWKARISIAAAVRHGRAVLLRYGRLWVGLRRPGEDLPATPDNAVCWLDRREIIRSLPRLPAGWRWAADDRGPYLMRHDGFRVRLQPSAIASALTGRIAVADLIAAADTANETRGWPSRPWRPWSLPHNAEVS